MSISPTVAWIDIADRLGVCPICIASPLARNPLAFDLIPVGVEGCAGKGCAECGAPLAGDPRDGARVVMGEYVSRRGAAV